MFIPHFVILIVFLSVISRRFPMQMDAQHVEHTLKSSQKEEFLTLRNSNSLHCQKIILQYKELFKNNLRRGPFRFYFPGLIRFSYNEIFLSGSLLIERVYSKTSHTEYSITSNMEYICCRQKFLLLNHVQYGIQKPLIPIVV